MVEERHELFDELEAFDPRWQSHYTTIRDAALHAGASALYYDWLNHTAEGLSYSVAMRNVRNYAVKRTGPSRSLPYSLDNIGEVPEDDETEGEGFDQAGDSGAVDWAE